MEMMRCLYTICVYLWYDHVIILCYVLIYSTWYVYSILWCAVWSMLHTVASIYVYIMCMTCHTYVYVYGIMVCMISWYVCTYLYGMYVHTYVCMCAYCTPGSGVYVLQGLVRRVPCILYKCIVCMCTMYTSCVYDMSYIMCMLWYHGMHDIMVCVCTYLWYDIHTYIPYTLYVYMYRYIRVVHHILCKYHSMYVYYVYIMCMLCHTSCVCLWYHGMHDIVVCVYTYLWYDIHV